MEREWRKIEDHPLYEVSNDGMIRSIARGKPKILKHWKHRHGYPMISLGRGNRFCIHALVLCAFAGPRPDGMEACHYNDIPDDNRIENLRWDTKEGNREDIRRRGAYGRGANHSHGNAKLTLDQVMEIYTSDVPGAVLAKKYGLFKNSIYAIRTGKTWAWLTGHKAQPPSKA